jgi:hypothetical protein
MEAWMQYIMWGAVFALGFALTWSLVRRKRRGSR